jgi:hypothetical protein
VSRVQVKWGDAITCKVPTELHTRAVLPAAGKHLPMDACLAARRVGGYGQDRAGEAGKAPALASCPDPSPGHVEGGFHISCRRCWRVAPALVATSPGQGCLSPGSHSCWTPCPCPCPCPSRPQPRSTRPGSVSPTSGSHCWIRRRRKYWYKYEELDVLWQHGDRTGRKWDSALGH